MAARSEVAREVLDEVIERIVEVARPERIIVFGSAARGEMGPHSDIDDEPVEEPEYLEAVEVAEAVVRWAEALL